MADSFYSAVHDGVEFEFFDLPGSNLFNIRVESHDGANFERLYHEKHGVPIYGAAHLVEHLSFKSPLDYKTNEYLNAMQRIGRYNASTNFTMIDYLMETVASEWKTAIKMVCNSAFNDLSGVTQEEFETERGVVINEINRYAEDNSTMFMMGIRSAIIGSDPFDNILGDPAFKNVTLGLCQEIKTHFIASAPIRVVVTYDSNSGIHPTAIVNEFFHNFERQTSDFGNDDLEELANPVWSKLVKESKNVTVVNPAEQVQICILVDMGKLLHPQVSQFVANYIADLAVDSSLTHFYREVHGMTYGCNLTCVTNKYGIGDSAVVDNMYMFTVDVEQKNVDLALKLFKEQIPIIAASFTRQAFEDLSITFALTESKKQLYRMAPLGAFGTRQNFYAHNDIVQTDDIRALMSYIRDRFFNFENVAVEMNVLAAKVANGEFITVTSTN